MGLSRSTNEDAVIAKKFARTTYDVLMNSMKLAIKLNCGELQCYHPYY